MAARHHHADHHKDHHHPEHHEKPHRSCTPLVYDGQLIRYNKAEGIPYGTPLILGSRQPQPGRDYQPNFLYFDPTSASLTTGSDNHLSWHLPLGLGSCRYPSSSAIIAGNRNLIDQPTSCKPGGVIIGCSGVTLQDSANTVILGFNQPPEAAPFQDLDQSVVAPKLYGLTALAAGSLDPQLQAPVALPTCGGVAGRTLEPILASAGDAVVWGSLQTAGALYAQDLVATGPAPEYPGGRIWGARLEVGVATVGRLSYETPTLSLVDAELTLNPPLTIQTVMAAPLHRPVVLTLNGHFPNGSLLTVKDATQFFQENTRHNVIIRATGGTWIETYACGQLSQVQNGSYALVTTAGAVTLQYIAALLPGGKSCWVILNQLIGRERRLCTPSVHKTGRSIPSSPNPTRNTGLLGPGLVSPPGTGKSGPSKAKTDRTAAHNSGESTSGISEGQLETAQEISETDSQMTIPTGY